LPGKDQAVFRSIVKFYEQKQYKKGVKAADTILKRHPDHGETLCMKGLTLSYLDKKEEAYELVRRGIKHDIRSHVCWHVYGLLYRQDRDYLEAVKCYRQALRIDAENMQILRDLSLLQIHRRDVTGFAETRRKLLQLKPSNRLNWIGLAISEHLCKSYEFAWTCIDNCEKMFKDENIAAYENSELYMYKAQVMEEAGKFEEALECLKQHEKQIVDKLGLLEAKGRLLMFLQRYTEAAEIYKKLLKCNPEHHTYVLAYMANQPQFHRFWPALPAPVPDLPKHMQDGGEEQKPAEPAAPLPATISCFPQTVHPSGTPIWGWLAPMEAGKQQNKRVAIGKKLHKRRLEAYEPLVPPTDAEEEEVCKFFDELLEEHPTSDSLKRLVLHFITGERFQRRLDVYLRTRLRKGVPSLFRTMRPLYFQAGKAELIEKLLLQYNKCLEEEVSWFGPAVGEAASGDREDEPPTSLLFTRMVTADHYDFLGDMEKALEYVNSAIAHTPTLVELYLCKARILRHAGNLKESAVWYEDGRSMDLADRYLNTQCVRAMLRLDDTQGGMAKALLFSKEPDSPEAANLHDMQCMWYESAVGRSYYRQKRYGKALKKFNETFKHFSDIAEDQFDFHNYCLKKTTLKAYVGMLRMQDRLYSHKFYRRAAKDAIKIYLELFDMKARGEAVGSSAANGDGNAEDMSAADKKRMKQKLKKEAAKAKAEPKAAAAGGKPKKVDDDPDGDKLLEKDPMEEANKLVKTLVMYCTNDAATHVLTYDVMCRQGKLLHCLQALLKLWELSGRDNTHYKLVAPLAHFCFVAELEKEGTPAAVREVILSEMAPVLGVDKAFGGVADLRVAATKVVDQVEKRVRGTAELPLAEAMYSLKCLRHAGRDLKGFLETEWNPQGAFALKECNKMMGYLSSEYGKDSPLSEKFKKRCQEIFPLMEIS